MWSGHNYAYEVVRHLGINEKEGMVRIGIAHYNSEVEVERCLTAIAASVARELEHLINMHRES